MPSDGGCIHSETRRCEQCAEIATLRSERDTALAELAEARKKLERDRTRLEAELAEAKEHAEFLRGQCKSLDAKADALAAELAEVRRERDGARTGRDDALAALDVARELGMSIEPRPEPAVWAMKNERAQHAEAEADAYRARVSVEEGARAEVEKALRSTTARAEAAESRLAQAEAALLHTRDVLAGLLGCEDNGPDLDAYLDGHVALPAYRAKLKAAKKMAKALERQGRFNERPVGLTGRPAGWCSGRCGVAGHSEDCEAGREALRLWKDAGGEG